MARQLNRTTFKFRFLRGLAAKLTTATNNYGLQGEPYYATDTKELYIHDGTSYVRVLAPTVPVTLKGYTVGTLPAGTIGDTCYVTDALAPAFLTAVVGGGAVKTPVFYNGAAWVAY